MAKQLRSLRRRAPEAPASPSAARRRPRVLLICAGLFLLTIGVYAQTRAFDFVNFDDPDSITANSHVRGGITAANVVWAFTSGEAANWFPLTRLSHMLDVQLFGLAAGWHHLTNVLLHALAVVLLFAFLRRASGHLWPSAWVAAIFALHPLHVESVAWIAERKDVLSGFFAMLALWSYARYAERPSLRRYLLVFLSLALGLMSKPMLVTLPFLFLLLDVWPLARLGEPRWSRLGPLLREKLPLFALSAAAACLTYLVQQASGAVRSAGAFPFLLRLENALVSGVVYIIETFRPTGLAVFYPYPRAIPVWQAGAAALALAGISILAIRSMRTRPYLAVGWFWYLGMLVPVIGLVQAGAQAHADRYTYLPMIGLTIMLAWGAVELIGRVPRARFAVGALAAASCAACGTLTWNQTSYWQDSATLFRHALDVTDGNYLAHHNLGVALASTPGGLSEAIVQYRAALAVQPGYARAHTDLGSALARLPGRLPDAIAEFRAAVAIDPNLAIPHNNLGSALAQSQRWDEAIAEYQAALRLDPGYAEARRNLAEAQSSFGLALANGGHPSQAVAHFEAALQLRPESAEAHNNLGVVLAQIPGRGTDAMAQFQAALGIDPNYADAHLNLGLALSAIPGRASEAVGQLEAADRIQPDPEVRRMIERLKAAKK